MMRNGWSWFLSLGLVFICGFLFQNCGGSKFKSSSGSSTELTSNGQPIDHGLIDPGSNLVAFRNAAQVSDSLPLSVNTAYEMRLLGDNLNPLGVVWSAKSGQAGFANCAVTGSALLSRTLNCSSVGIAHVEAVAALSDGTSITKVFEKAVSDTGTTLPPTNLVTFNIPAGTGRKPWNTIATAAVVFRGQTLRVINQDTTAHRLHTGGRPCAHQPASILTGQAFDCVVSAAHAANALDTYDHLAGNTANFFINAIDGAALYNTTKFNIGGQMRGCVDCHGALATSAQKNASFAMVKAAIAGNMGGMGAITLSDDQLRAVIYELAK